MIIRIVAAIRRVFAQRRIRAALQSREVPYFVRQQIAKHETRVTGAITRNRLSDKDARAVRDYSSDLVSAYHRGRIAVMDDATLMAIDYANRLGNAAAVAAVRDVIKRAKTMEA